MKKDVVKYNGWTLIISYYDTKTKVWIDELKIWGYFTKGEDGKWNLNEGSPDLKICEAYLNNEDLIEVSESGFEEDPETDSEEETEKDTWQD